LTVTKKKTEEPTDMYHLLDAISDAIGSCDPAKRETLARTIDAYCEDSPEEFFWAMGAQSPVLLYHLMMSIDSASRPDVESKPRPVIRLVDRKPVGNG
jgi:hypothetical protein